MDLIFAGDILVTRSLRGALDREVLNHLIAVLRGGDAVFGNLETLLHTFTAPPSADSGAPGSRLTRSLPGSCGSWGSTRLLARTTTRWTTALVLC